ncbi:MAG: lipopolysaccharide heptosyltransferase II [Candidatus Omnitrophica bacterium]|nr:lipopolysaccharide heptosyltransferase II [Candidatus Omnitrophota bacterium]
MKSLKRILIFNVNWLGDVLFSTATIRNIRLNFPDAFLACVIPSRCYPVLRDNPHLNEIIIYDEKDRHKGMVEKMNFAKKLKDKKFDAVFLLHRSFTRTLICRLAEIPQRIGHSTKKRNFLLTKKIKMPKRDSLHRIDFYLNIIEKAGLRVEDRYTEFFVSEEDNDFIDKFLKERSVLKKDTLVGLNPGGNWMPKRWPSGYWARLADKLISELRSKVIITGSTSDIALTREIENSMLQKPISASAVLNINQLAALCRRLDLFIAADTGPLHIANAARAKKIIALFGPTSREITGPYPGNNVTVISKDVGCEIPCYVRSCKDNRCMKAITPEEVFAQAKLALHK